MRLAEARSRASRSHRSYVNRERFRLWSFHHCVNLFQTRSIWILHVYSLEYSWVLLMCGLCLNTLGLHGVTIGFSRIGHSNIFFGARLINSSGEHLRLTDALSVLKRLIRLDMSLDCPSYFPFSHLCSTMTWTRMNMLRAELVDQLQKIKPLKKSYLGVGLE